MVFSFKLMYLLVIQLLGLMLTESIQAKNDPQTNSIPYVNEVVTIDGNMDERFWKSAHTLPLTMSQPVYGNSPSSETTVKVAHSGNAIYVGGYFKYNSSDINDRQLSRDDLDFSSDLFGLVIDGYNDKKSANVFITSPSGNKTDLAVTDDAEFSKNLNWDAFWTVKVNRQDTYWSFEMRIPLSSLQYQKKDGKVVVGLSVWKYSAENNEFDTYPLISNDYGNDSYFKPSKTAVFSFNTEIGTKSKPLFVTPYLLGGYGHEQLNSGANHSQYLPNIGLDAKYKLSSNFTLDATVNTDFAHVEDDNQQINLTRFPLHREEKRAFFQERAGLFSFNTGGPTDLFYSRRIGLTDEGKEVPIDGGVRLAGRTGRWDIGALSVQSAPKYGAEGESFGVFRARRNISDDRSSYVGFMSTSRVSRSGVYNLAYGADMVWEGGRDLFITGRYSHTFDDPGSSGYTFGWLNNTNMLVKAERKSYVGFFYKFSINRVGQSYNPGLGFVDRTDFTRYGDRIAYGWEAPEHSFIQKYQLITDAHIYVGNTTNELESSSILIKNYTSFKSGFVIQLGVKHQSEHLTTGYNLSERVYIPAGQHGFEEVFINFSTSKGNRFRLDASTSVGGFFDGKGVATGISPEWSINPNFELSGNMEYYNINFEERGQLYRSLLLRGRLDVKPAPNISISGLAQYNSLTNVTSSFARLRFNIADGSDLFLVYRFGQNKTPFEQLHLNDPVEMHSLQAKFNYTFQY